MYWKNDIQASNQTTETGTIQSGRTRVFGVRYAGPAVAGNITLRDGGGAGTIKCVIDKAAQIDSGTVNFPGAILFKTDVYAAFTTEQVTAITVFHSGGSNT
tara:strand:- start:451 stop:753 length:303 start_codon:yes stop_codon:yes gene_type:complete